MPRRKQILATNEIYHIYDRTVGHENIFSSKRELGRIINLIDYYRFSHKVRYSQFRLLSEDQQKVYLAKVHKQVPLIEIYAFSLMPNHYHFLLQQLQNRGILLFISTLQNSYAKYYNIKNKRHGTLFQSPFKAKRIESDEELIHISRYIHLNPVTSYLLEFDSLTTYPWTSFISYTKESPYRFMNSKKILSLFRSYEQYYKFVADQSDYQRKLGVIKHLVFD